MEKTNITPTKIHTKWLVITCGLLTLYYVDSMWSQSVDLAHHYALAFRISEQWTLASQNDPTLGEMNIYPRVSHIIAAIIGTMTGSIFLGIQIATLLSLALLWLGTILTLNTLRTKLAIASTLLFVTLIALNAISLKLNTHGHEIIGNFFYSQLMGHSVLLLSIPASIYIEKKFGIVRSVMFLTALMLANAGIHLLPALEMLGMILGLLLIYVFFNKESDIQFRYRLTIAISIGFASTFSILIHPSFSAMRSLSENNGGLLLHNISYPYGLGFLCFVVFFSSLAILFCWIHDIHRAENSALKYISFYGGTTAALCLLQFLLTKLGYGSDYAAKKYIFGLSTALLLNTSILLSLFIDRLYLDRNFTYFSSFKSYVLLGSLCILFFYSIPTKKMLDTSDVVSIERKLVELSSTTIPPATPGKSNVVVGLENMPNTINYMFSIAVLKTVRDIAIPDVLAQNAPSIPKNYSYIASSYQNTKFGAGDCNSLSKTDISIISSNCLEERYSKASDCRAGFDFSAGSGVPASLLQGFGTSEKRGRWTNGKLASFSCNNLGAPLTRVKLDIAPFIAGIIKSQRLGISINGIQSTPLELSAARDFRNPIVIEIPKEVESKRYSISFEIPNAASPKSLGLSEDNRELGFRLRSIIFE
ncbi:hypothetical protein Y695_00797 [Hydrogenophaga sp. T4]|nr:hypothetical protein Y695_00797 [Hydrogenophaga sp. T4]